MSFGIFTGVNNKQSVCFASIIMCDKSADSFIWIFNTFLKMVNYHASKIFLIDKDYAIIKAVD